MIKKIVFLFLSVFMVIFASQQVVIAPCDRPISFKVDVVDGKFHLSKDKFLEYTKKAADIWNKAYGKNLLVFDPNGTLSINLIYDERQLLNFQINNSKGNITNQEGTLSPRIAQYQKDVISFKMNSIDLNNQIESWNQKGGASPDVYNQLIQKQRDLQNEADRLNAEAKDLNLTTQNLNNQIVLLNQKVDTFNTALEQRPEEGIYFGDRNRIEIYFYVTQNELIRTIAHEMGHARGLQHTTNSVSIMYPKTNKVLVPSKEDLDELRAICTKGSLYDALVRRVKSIKLN